MRVRLGLAIAGAVAGIAGFLTGAGWLALVAGACAVGAGVGERLWGAPGSGTDGQSAVAAATQPPQAQQAADVQAAMVDPATGLFTADFFEVALESRLSAARRHLRPLAVVLLAAADGDDHNRPVEPAVVAAAIRATLRDADTACLLRDGRFAFILEDTPEEGAIWTVERVRRALSSTGEHQVRWAGVACYPAHAFSTAALVAKAERAFGAARSWLRDRTEVATAD